MPRGYGPHETLHNRFVRWLETWRGSRLRILAALLTQTGAPALLMIDSTHLKAHRTVATLAIRGIDAYVDHAAPDAPAAG